MDQMAPAELVPSTAPSPGSGMAAVTPRGQRRRQQILDVAVRCFAEVGYRGASLRDIAAAAEVTHQGLARYFRDKDHVLEAVVERFEAENLAWWGAHTAPGKATDLAAVARRNAATPGYVELFTTLAGEATTSSHHAHEAMRQRYRRMRKMASAALSLLGDGDEGTRLLAAWDGLQLMSRYASNVDVPNRLERYVARKSNTAVPERTDAFAADSGSRSAEATPRLGSWLDEKGYLPGRNSRSNIVSEAMALFSQQGFHETTLQDVATAAGMAKSTLLHHVGSKDDLVVAVLQRRDELLAPPADAARWTSGRLVEWFLEQARRSGEDLPGLISVYAVLSCESAAREHPAHEYFMQRFERGRAAMTDVFVDLAHEGRLSPDRDPQEEADWFIALWDGLQYQWLYEPDAVDIASLLRGHLDAIVEA